MWIEWLLDNLWIVLCLIFGIWIFLINKAHEREIAEMCNDFLNQINKLKKKK